MSGRMASVKDQIQIIGIIFSLVFIGFYFIYLCIVGIGNKRHTSKTTRVLGVLTNQPPFQGTPKFSRQTCPQEASCTFYTSHGRPSCQHDFKFVVDFLKSYFGREIVVPRQVKMVAVAKSHFRSVGHRFLLEHAEEVTDESYFLYKLLHAQVQATYFVKDGFRYLAGICIYLRQDSPSDLQDTTILTELLEKVSYVPGAPPPSLEEGSDEDENLVLLVPTPEMPNLSPPPDYEKLDGPPPSYQSVLLQKV